MYKKKTIKKHAKIIIHRVSAVRFDSEGGHASNDIHKKIAVTKRDPPIPMTIPKTRSSSMVITLRCLAGLMRDLLETQ